MTEYTKSKQLTYIVFDIETVPLLETHDFEYLEEDDKLKLINPIDSKVIAIGIMKDEKYNIYLEQNYTEKEMLELFWSELDHSLKESHNTFYVVGFNILQFDLPFLITRSFIHNVKVCANLNQKIICDIKDRLSYTRKGYVRGKLKEFASLLGMSILPYDGRVINKLYVNQDWDSIRDYLKKDLEITNELFKRLLSTGIFDMTSR